MINTTKNPAGAGRTDGVHLGLPSYDGNIGQTVALAALHTGTRKRQLTTSTAGVSLLGFCFNQLWCVALSSREERGNKWFAMLHGDITPEPWWIDTLIAEAEEHGADVMSAVSPIKNLDGISSTAISDPADPFSPLMRLGMRQINDPAFPGTFDVEAAKDALRSKIAEPLRANVTTQGARLLVNTGCFVARLDKPWAEKVCFTIQDRIVRHPDGTFTPEVEPEDWRFSRDVADLGGKVFATKKVRLLHRGHNDYPSYGSWGLDRDLLCAKHGL